MKSEAIIAIIKLAEKWTSTALELQAKQLENKRASLIQANQQLARDLIAAEKKAAQYDLLQASATKDRESLTYLRRKLLRMFEREWEYGCGYEDDAEWQSIYRDLQKVVGYEAPEHDYEETTNV